MEGERQAHIELDQALFVGEELWHHKARIKWHCEGDRKRLIFIRFQR